MSYIGHLIGGMYLLVYLAAMWEGDRQRLLVQGAVAAVILVYILATSSYPLGSDRVFFVGMAGAWLLGVATHWLGLWMRGRGWAVGRWRVLEVVGGIAVSVPLILGLMALLSETSA